MKKALNQVVILITFSLVLAASINGYCQESEQLWDQFELAVSSGAGATGLAIGEGLNISDRVGPRRCHFAISTNTGAFSHYHQNRAYDFSTNPEITFLNERNQFLGVCMSVNSNYSSGELEFFLIDPDGSSFTPIDNTLRIGKGIPDKPIVRQVHGGRSVLAFTQVSYHPNHRPLVQTENRAFYFNPTDGSRIEINFTGQTLSNSPAALAIGPQGIDATEVANRDFPTIMTYGEYGTNRIHVCEIQGRNCVEKALLFSVELSTPITRVNRNQDGTISLIVYDAHEIGNGELFIISGDGTTILHRKRLNQVATGTFVSYEGRNLFLMQTRINDRASDINYTFFDPVNGWSCADQNITNYYTTDDYIGAYIDSDEENAYVITRDNGRQAIQVLNFSSSSCLQSSASQVENSNSSIR